MHDRHRIQDNKNIVPKQEVLTPCETAPGDKSKIKDTFYDNNY